MQHLLLAARRDLNLEVMSCAGKIRQTQARLPVRRANDDRALDRLFPGAIDLPSDMKLIHKTVLSCDALDHFAVGDVQETDLDLDLRFAISGHQHLCLHETGIIASISL